LTLGFFVGLALDLREFYEKAEGGIFKKYLPDFERAVSESPK
jgi:hypothetical protein